MYFHEIDHETRFYDTSGKDTRKKESEQSKFSMDCCGKKRIGWEEDKHSY
jgi:hypothetical protein